jgi:hypothetical protein
MMQKIHPDACFEELDIATGDYQVVENGEVIEQGNAGAGLGGSIAEQIAAAYEADMKQRAMREGTAG